MHVSSGRSAPGPSAGPAASTQVDYETVEECEACKSLLRYSLRHLQKYIQQKSPELLVQHISHSILHGKTCTSHLVNDSFQDKMAAVMMRNKEPEGFLFHQSGSSVGSGSV